MRRTMQRSLLFTSLILAFATGCTFTGTTEATVDPTLDFTSSTSGRIWWNDGLLKSDYKALAFAAYNRGNLEQDLARGNGEYLASLDNLFGIGEQNRPAFHAAAQQRFESLAPVNPMMQIQQLRSLLE